MQNISDSVRLQVLRKHRFYIPNRAIVCSIHCESRAWNNINNFRQANTFNKDHIADMVDLLRGKHFRAKDVMLEHSSDDIKILTGLTSEQFRELSETVPALRRKFKNNILARNALFMYLMRLRTGQTLAQIALKFNVSMGTIINRLKIVRNILHKKFVPLTLKSVWTRDYLIENTTSLSRILYGLENQSKVVLIFDGTYIYVEKSNNQTFQKKSYTDQKKRNFVKVMMCVTTNGKIVFASGPYAAVDNDAKILKSIINQDNCQVFSQLGSGDVCIVDRGFRDCVNELNSLGLDVRIPENIKKNPDGSTKKQLTIRQANNKMSVCRGNSKWAYEVYMASLQIGLDDESTQTSDDRLSNWSCFDQ